MGYFSISDNTSIGDEKHGPETVVIVASGELDYGARPQLRDRLLGHIGAGARHLLLDLSAVTFIDSTAIGTLVDAVTRLRGSGGGALAVVCPGDNERVRRIFDIVEVASLIEIYRSREEAVSALTAAQSVEMPAWMKQATVSRGRREPRLPRLSSVGLSVARKYAQEADTAAGAPRDAHGRGDIARKLDELA